MKKTGRAEEEIAIKGTNWLGKPMVPTYRGNRICEYPKCNTVLSIYNKNKFCFLHATKFRWEKYGQEQKENAKKKAKKGMKKRKRNKNGKYKMFTL